MGKRLKDLRNGKKLRIQDVVNATGISTGNLSGLENDSGVNVGYKSLIKLARLYNVSVSYIIGETDSKIPDNFKIIENLGLTDEAIDCIASINKSSNSQRAHIDNLHYFEISVLNNLIISDTFHSFLNRIKNYCVFQLSKPLDEDSKSWYELQNDNSNFKNAFNLITGEGFKIIDNSDYSILIKQDLTNMIDVFLADCTEKYNALENNL